MRGNNNDKYLIRLAFHGEPITPEQERAVSTMLEYIRSHGTQLPPLREGRDDAPFLNAVESTLSELYGIDIETLFNAGRKETSVMLRNFCYDAYASAYPMATIGEISKAYGNKRDRVTVQYQMKKFPDDLLYDRKTAEEYRKFKETLNAKIQMICSSFSAH